MKFCPVCRLYLEALDWRGLQLHACSSCGGVWAPLAALGHLTSDLRAEVHDLLNRPSAAAMPLTFAGSRKPCPDCMTAFLEPDERVDLPASAERCPRCSGVWLAPLNTDGPVQSAAETPPEAPRSEPPLPQPTLDVTEPSPIPQAAERVQPSRVEVLFEEPELPCHSADEAWRRLAEGNERFVAGRPSRRNAGVGRLTEALAGQHPFAAVVSCSDSRVPPEIVFDRGIGDLFVVRTAGHVVTRTALGSLLYAVDHLETPLVVILGHTRCGAIHAALESEQSAYLEPVMRAIRPAVQASAGMPGLHWDNAVKVHVARTVRAVKSAMARQLPLRSAAIVGIVGAVCDLETGAVALLPDDFAVPEAETPPTEPERRDEDRPVRVVVNAGPETLETAREPLGEPDVEQPSAPSAELGPPGDPSRSRFPHWCPRCRAGYDANTAFCTTCGVLLVQPWFRVPCTKCGKENLIGEERCFNCRAPLHPSWMTSGKGRPKPPPIVVRVPGRSSSANGCGTSALAILALGAGLWVWCALRLMS